MSTPEFDDSSRQARLDEVLAAYMQRLDRGELVDRERFLAEHADMADELRSYFEGSDELKRLAESSGRDVADQTAAWTEPAAGVPPAAAFAAASTLDAEAGVTAAPAVGAKVRYVGDYELLEELGRGGMGVVYQARQSRLKRLVALKMILAGDYAGPQELARFRSEAEAVARLQHPNIVQIYEVGEHEGNPYFSLEFCPGGSLDRKLHGTPLPPREAAALLETLARAMHAAHQAGVVHRDLKPANVLLTADGTPKITDFGLAKKLGGEPGVSTPGLTASGAIMGTPSYMAPEQAGGQTRDIGPAADVYALGAILYELLTGRPPFKAATPLDTALQVVRDEPVPPSRLQPKVPRDLETICLKCLQKDPRHRYPSAQGLADDLRRFLSQEPIRARRASAWEHGVKWARRRPTAAALAVVSTAAALGLLVLAGFLWQNAEARAAAVQDLAAAHRNLGAARAEQQAAEAQAAAQQRLAQGKRAEVQQLEQLADQERARARAAQETARRTVYAADMQFAHAAWEKNSVPRVLAFLERYRPQPGQEDVRGFEWYYLWRLCHSDRLTLPAYPDAPGPLLGGLGDLNAGLAIAVAFSPDGKTLASGRKDQKIKLWDVATGKELRALPPAGLLVGLAFAPDGKSLVMVTRKTMDLNARLARSQELQLKERDELEKERQDVMTGKSPPSLKWLGASLELQTLDLDGHKPATAEKFDPARLVGPLMTGLEGGMALTDIKYSNGLPLSKGRLFLPMSLALAPDRKVLAIGGQLTTIPLAQPGKRDQPGGAALWDLSKVEQAGGVLLWDLNTGREKAMLKGHSFFVTSVAFAPDGRTLASAGGDMMIQFWDLNTGQERATLRGHTAPVSSIVFAADGKTLASASWDGTVKLWDAATGQVQANFKGHLKPVAGVALAPDGKALASGSFEGIIKLWDPVAAPGPMVIKGYAQPVQALAFSADGKTLAGVDRGGTLKLCAVTTGHERVHIDLNGKSLNVIDSCAAFAPDGKTVALANLIDGAVRLFDVATGQERFTLKGNTDGVTSLVFSPDGKMLAAGIPGWPKSGTVKLWDVSTGKETRTLRGPPSIFGSLAFSPDSKTLASGSGQVGQLGEVTLWDVTTGKELLTIKGHGDAAHQVAFAPDGKRLASAWKDSVTIHDATTGKELLTLRGYSDEISNAGGLLTISPDGKRLATASSGWDSGEVKLWDLSTGLEVLDLGPYPGIVGSLTFSPDGKRLAAGFAEAQLNPLLQGQAGVRIWDATPIEERPSQPAANPPK